MRVESQILIDAPIDRVWELVTDPDLAPRWNPNVIAVSGFAGKPVKLGSSWSQDVRILGRIVTMRAEVIECDAPRMGTVRLDGLGTPVIATRLTEEGEGTRLHQSMEIGAAGGLGAIAARIAQPTVQSELDEALRRQKEAVEGR